MEACYDKACLRQAQQAQTLLKPARRGSYQAGSACQERGGLRLSSSLQQRPLRRTVPIYCHAPRPRPMTPVIAAGRRWTGERGFLHSPSPILATSGAACFAFYRRAHVLVNRAAAQCVLLQHLFTPCSDGFNPKTTPATAMAQCGVAAYLVPMSTVLGGLSAQNTGILQLVSYTLSSTNSALIIGPRLPEKVFRLSNVGL